MMFQHQGIWLPDGEKHFPDWMTKNGEIVDGRGTYQIKKWRACHPWIKDWRIAVDVGAHVGLWSIQMVASFNVVHAFEPMSVFRECWEKNLGPNEMFVSSSGYKCWKYLHDCALGASAASVIMNYNPADSGNTHVGGNGDIELKTLDSFQFVNVDFIKIDCEGYEANVIQGARETIERCKPCIIVEQKPHKLMANFGIKGAPAVELLQSMGAIVRKEMSGDFILSFD